MRDGRQGPARPRKAPQGPASTWRLLSNCARKRATQRPALRRPRCGGPVAAAVACPVRPACGRGSRRATAALPLQNLCRLPPAGRILRMQVEPYMGRSASRAVRRRSQRGRGALVPKPSTASGAKSRADRKNGGPALVNSARKESEGATVGAFGRLRPEARHRIAAGGGGPARPLRGAGAHSIAAPRPRLGAGPIPRRERERSPESHLRDPAAAPGRMRAGCLFTGGRRRRIWQAACFVGFDNGAACAGVGLP